MGQIQMTGFIGVIGPKVSCVRRCQVSGVKCQEVSDVRCQVSGVRFEMS